MSKIAIIGAGIAGLSALQRLAASGHEVWVFDKSRGSGGRIASKRVGDASWDMGAQFLVAHGTEFANQLADWERAGWIAEWPVVPWVIKSGLQEPSPDDQKRYVAMPRMTSLSRCLLKPAQEFITSTRITSLKREGQHWNLESESGQRWENFDKVVLAIPPEQASALLADAPELLPLCDQIMLPCWTLLLSYSRRLEAPFEAAFVKDHAISWIARNNSKPMRDDRETWVIQANHQWSREHCDAPRAEVQQKLLSEFKTIVPDAKQLDSSEIWLHRWLYAIPKTPLAPESATDRSGTLVMAGDWLHSANLEGAWLSGQLAGSKID